MIRALVFDLDNTLVPCFEYFAHTRAQCFTRLLDLFPGEKPSSLGNRFNAIELGNMQKPDGFSRLRYPQSMVSLYHDLCVRYGASPTPRVAAELYAIGDSVFEAPYLLYDGVRPMLQRYKDAGIRLGLCTKGDAEVQGSKIERNGLRDLFDVVQVVPQKLPESIANTALLLGVHPDRHAAKVGDSLRDDIRGGALAGMTTVWVRGGIDPEYVYERGYDQFSPTHSIRTVLELPTVLPPDAE